MEIKGIARLLAEHPVFRGFDADTLDLLEGCAQLVHFGPGELIQREGSPADRVLVLRKGDAAIEVAPPQGDAVVVETLHGGDVLGWGWLIPPYRTMFDARAVSALSAVSLDATCIRGKCDAHPALGYQMFKHWLPHLAARFRSQRLQLLDLYGRNGG